MFTLDKISTQLAYQEKPQCVFEQLGKCSVNREFGIVCREHARQVFGIGLMTAVLVLPTGESRHHAVVATESRRTFLPFPYDFQKTAAGVINTNERPSLNRDALRNEIKDYVQQMEINSPVLNFSIESALISLLSDGTIYNQALPQASYNFHVFSNQNIRSYLLKRWENCNVAVKYTVNGQIQFAEYPVDKLPVFYQIMLMYLTMSYNVLDTTTNPDATNTSQVLTIRIILNADRHRFEYCNNKDPSKLFLLRGNATTATPLVLAGQQVHKYNIDLFKQGTYYTFSLLDHFDICPPSAVPNA